MYVFAQIPGADQALKAAESQGWTAVLVCTTFLFALLGLVWLIKQIFLEKDRLANRLTTVEDFQKGKLVELHTQTTMACLKAAEAATSASNAMDNLTSALKAEGCPYPNMAPPRPGRV